jgi:hypothetical protein
MNNNLLQPLELGFGLVFLFINIIAIIEENGKKNVCCLRLLEVLSNPIFKGFLELKIGLLKLTQSLV